MVRMIIDRPFNLLLGGGQKVAFKAGEQDVADDLADHWYVKANGRPASEAPALKRKRGVKEQDEQGAPSAAPNDAEVGENSDPVGQDPAGQDGEAANGEEVADAAEGGETADNSDAGTDDRASLVVEATSLGINVDGRWGADRIKSAIAEAKKG